EPLMLYLKKKIEEYSKRPEIMEKLSGIEASVQVRPVDDKPFFLRVSGGFIEINEGELIDPLVTVIARKNDLKKLIDREADPFVYYFAGKIRVTGRVFEAAELLRILLKEIK
ncbi:MAG: SCP2 sterol-binding domain-containing protein, partial [Nitrososphaerota archaeon]